MTEPAYPIAFPEDGQTWPGQGEWTYADYLRLPEDGRRYEVIRGHLYVTPAPNFDHQYAVTQLGRLCGNFVAEHRLGTVLVAPFDVLLPRGIATPVQPDLVFFRTGNEPRRGDGRFEGTPDLVVEVLSPGTRRVDERIKGAAYREAGIPEIWMVDPSLRTIVIYGRSGEPARAGAGRFVISQVLPGLRIAVEEILPR